MMNMQAVFLFVFVVIVSFLQISPPAAAAAESLELWSGRDELVKWAGYGEEKLSTVVISGRILCNTAHDSINPVSGARVAVMCGKLQGRRLSSSSSSSGSTAETDGSGKFVIDLPSHLHAIPNLEKVCHVRIVQLPGSSPCRRACAAKHNKPIHLDLDSLDQGVRSYTTHTIHLSKN